MLQRKPFVASLRNLTVFLPAGRLRENGKPSSAYFLDYYQNMVKRGAINIMAPNRSVAKKIAGNNPIREYHAGPGSRYTHYHPNPRNGSHIWYGKPR
ncbi:Uncharacterised protein [Moraxella ovis]|uniref:Uncharacterized protein n=1 Tax=Moraxella ovis TaxID=29433 RepID=A0A378PMF8_9GAMM|nr:Uncharacterised protein [Moraxella ovis]